MQVRRQLPRKFGDNSGNVLDGPASFEMLALDLLYAMLHQHSMKRHYVRDLQK